MIDMLEVILGDVEVMMTFALSQEVLEVCRVSLRQSLGVCLKLVLLLFENSFVSLNLFTVLMHL